jgi:hypothetical protein
VKQCAYCGHENADEVTACRECGAALAVENEQGRLKLVEFCAWWKKPLRASVKNGLWWAIVVAAWFYIRPAAIVYLPFFTVGLAGEGVPALVLWIFYVAITIAGLRAKTRWGYFLFYSLFSVLLMLNAVGCRRIFDDLSQME